MTLDEFVQGNEYKKKIKFKNSPVHAYVKIVSAPKEIEKKLSTR